MKLEKHPKEHEIYSYHNTKGEKLWMFRHKYYDALGERKEKKKTGFKTDKAAIKALLEIKAKTLHGQTKQIENDNLTVGQWLDMWYETNSAKWKDGTRIQREHIIRLHLKPLLGNFKLQKIDRLIYRKNFLNKLEGKFKPSTIRLWHNIFKIAINAAVEDEILPRNRFNNMDLHEDDKNETYNYLTPEEIVPFLNDIKENENQTTYTFFLTLVYTGMRKGEALGLQWKNIDFENHTITIERTRDDKGIYTPKTKNSYRTIPVDQSLIEQLATYKNWCKKTLLSFGKKIKDTNFIFIFEDTSPIYAGFPNYVLKRVIKRTSLKDITIHGIRHAHATILMNEKYDVKAIAERLGNTPDMIYKIYGHVLKELEKEAVVLFGQSLNRASGAKSGAN